MGIFSMG